MRFHGVITLRAALRATRLLAQQQDHHLYITDGLQPADRWTFFSPDWAA